MRMKLKLTDLEDYDEFRTLFTNYKLKSWKITRHLCLPLLPRPIFKNRVEHTRGFLFARTAF